MDRISNVLCSAGVVFGRVLATAFFFLIASCIIEIWSRPVYPKHLPRVGYGPGLVASIKTFFKTPSELKLWVEEGYRKYNKNGRSFIIPAGLGRRPTLVLAPSQFKWFFEQPDTIISLDAASNESLYAKYNFLGDANPKDHFNNTIVHRNLAKALSGLVPGMQEDIQYTIDLKLGLDKENWKCVNTWGMWLTTIPRVSNVMILGKELGRNPKVVGAFVQFVQLVHHNIGTLNKFFSTLHPLIGRWLARRNQECFDRATAYTMPVIQQRLLDMEKKATDHTFKWQEPEDAITWCIRQARADNNMKELQAKSIAKRLLLVELGSVFTTAITAQNTLLDIISSSSSDVDALREEAVRVFADENQKWTQTGVAKLVRLDSAIRESQRYSNFAVTMLDHKVVAPEGVTNESEGWHVPYGALLNVNLNGVYHDPELHPDPERYDPLRFSRSLEAGTVDEKKRFGIVSTSEEHLVFGHGKRACPGRFFVALELKMAIAYILINYEIKPLAKRPAGTIQGNFVIPPLTATMEVRRRS